MVLIAALALVQAVAAAPEGAADPMAALIAETAPAAAPINCAGTHRQGAMIVCRTRPGAEVTLGDISVEADDEGWVVLGHDRDAEATRLLDGDLFVSDVDDEHGLRRPAQAAHAAEHCLENSCSGSFSPSLLAIARSFWKTW